MRKSTFFQTIAVWLFLYSFTVHAWNADSTFNEAKTAFRNTDYSRSVDLLMQYRDSADVNYALEYYLGMSFYNLVFFDWASVHLERAREMEQTHEDAILYVLSNIYSSLGKIDLSQERLGELRSFYPKSTYVHTTLNTSVSSHTAVNGGTGVSYHTDFFGLEQSDTLSMPKTSGAVYDMNGGVDITIGSNTFGFSLTHNNALEKGITSYTNAQLEWGKRLNLFQLGAGTSLSLSGTQIANSNLSLNGSFTRGKLSANMSWTWQYYPDKNIKANHVLYTSMRQLLYEGSQAALAAGLLFSFNRSSSQNIEHTIAAAYVAGVTEGLKTETAFFTDPTYSVPAQSATVGWGPSRYNDVPHDSITLETSGQWLRLKNEVPATQVRAQPSLSFSFSFSDNVGATFSPGIQVRKYLEKYLWYELPQIDDRAGNLVISLILDPDFRFRQDNTGDYFLVYRNFEDGALYYRINGGRYYRLNIVNRSAVRTDWGLTLPLSVNIAPAPWMLINLSYTFSLQRSNLPENAPVWADFADHGINAQISFFFKK